MKITTIYDNYRIREDLAFGWGFSCLIEINNKNILFDAGEEDKKIFSNMEKLGIDVKDAGILFISHEHWDHTGALKKIMEKNPNIKLHNPTEFTKPTKLMDDVYTTGALESSSKEQSLIIETKKGLVIITGCAHPGIVNIVKKAKEFLNKNIYLVLGGFHLESADEKEIEDIITKLEELGVENISPSHCTGKESIKIFEEYYKKRFTRNGAGTVIDI
ncbi:MBL fold metallo-hydrolase [Candidatus Woesearchaeota archaeon]|nr:MBL fold metallo-hydrolase [Candidatus Woesearchaeota archaeon]